MVILNNVVAYVSDVLILAGTKVVEVGTIAGEAIVEITKKVLLLG